MPRSSLQFHADPEELVSTLLPRWIDDAEDVHFLAVTQRPRTGARQRVSQISLILSVEE